MPDAAAGFPGWVSSARTMGDRGAAEVPFPGLGLGDQMERLSGNHSAQI
jgi:hypothetical protein